MHNVKHDGSQKIPIFRCILNLRSQTVHRPVILSFSHTSLIRVPNWTRTAESYNPALFPPPILLTLTDLGISLAFAIALGSQVPTPTLILILTLALITVSPILLLLAIDLALAPALTPAPPFPSDGVPSVLGLVWIW